MGYDARIQKVIEQDIYIDNAGVEMDEQDALDTALENIMDSLSKTGLAKIYLENLDEFDIMVWATNEHGNFFDE